MQHNLHGLASFTTGCCDGKTQGGNGSWRSLKSRNDMNQLQRSQMLFGPKKQLATKTQGYVGGMFYGTCDKELPALVMTACGFLDLPIVVVLGGAMIPTTYDRDMILVQNRPIELSKGEATIGDLEVSCQACPTMTNRYGGGGCTFGGTAWSEQQGTEFLGLAAPWTAGMASGTLGWYDSSRRATDIFAKMLGEDPMKPKITGRDILTAEAFCRCPGPAHHGRRITKLLHSSSWSSADRWYLLESNLQCCWNDPPAERPWLGRPTSLLSEQGPSLG